MRLAGMDAGREGMSSDLGGVPVRPHCRGGRSPLMAQRGSKRGTYADNESSRGLRMRYVQELVIPPGLLLCR